MKMKVVASLAFLLNTLLFGSYYSVAKEMLGRVDPIVFIFLVMMTLVPPALCIIAVSWRNMTRAAVKSGFLLGSCLYLGLCMLAVALKYNTATGTAFFPSLNGLVAALFTWMFLRQPITKGTWFAGLVSVVGAVMLMMNASMGGPRGALIAFLGGLFCTFYVFLADREQKDPAAYWPLFGVELLTMALWANLVALLFGNWQVVNFVLPKDVGIVLYIGIGTTFLPTLFTVLLQKYISPVTVSFIYILEPILGAVVAFLYLHEVLPLDGYLGGGLIVAGALIHTWGALERPASRLVLRRKLSVAGERVHTSFVGVLVYPLLCCAVGVFIAYKLGGFPPSAWRDLYRLSPQIPSLLHQGQGGAVFLLIAQSCSWLIAWVSLIVMGCLATYRAVGKLSAAPAPTEVVSVDVRTLRQMGYMPYTRSARRRRKVENPRVQRRRQQRRERLVHMEARLRTRAEQDILHELSEADFDDWAEFDTQYDMPAPHVTGRKSGKIRLVACPDKDWSGAPSIKNGLLAEACEEQPVQMSREQYNDAFGHWAYWDDLGTTEVRER